MSARLLRRQIIGYISQNEFADASKLTLSIGANESEIKKQLDILSHDGLLTFLTSTARTLEERKYVHIQLTPDGWKALEVQDHEAQNLSPTISNVWNFYGSKIDNLVQNYGNDVTINQTSSSDSISAILQIVDKMVEEIHHAPDVSHEIKNDYSIEAQSFKGELRKSRINLRRLREMLAFLGDVDGTLGLAVRLAPWFIALEPHIEKLISQMVK